MDNWKRKFLTRDIENASRYYLSDKQASKLKNSTEDVANKIYFQDKFLEDILSIFQWNNLPDDIPSYIMEYFLLMQGKLLMYYDEEKKKYVVSRFVIDSYNDYYQPITVHTISIGTAKDSNKSIGLNYDEFVYCYNNRSGTNSVAPAFYLADKLFHIEKTIAFQLRFLRNPVVFSGDQGLKDTVNRIMNSDSQEWFVVDKNTSLKAVQILPTKGSEIDTLIELRRIYSEEWNNRIALHSAPAFKKERFTKVESENYDEIGNINIAGMYQERLRFCEEANKKWGLNISVEYNMIIKNRENYDVLNDDQKEGVVDEDI